MKRKLIIPDQQVKVTVDVGTPNEQTITKPYVLTYLDVFLYNVGWWLSEHMWVEENLPRWDDGVHGYPNGLHAGTGFFMSQKAAGRIYWVWRGHTKWSLFFGRRKKDYTKIFEFERYK